MLLQRNRRDRREIGIPIEKKAKYLYIVQELNQYLCFVMN